MNPLEDETHCSLRQAESADRDARTLGVDEGRLVDGLP
jgi:hypothetical protein